MPLVQTFEVQIDSRHSDSVLVTFCVLTTLATFFFFFGAFLSTLLGITSVETAEQILLDLSVVEDRQLMGRIRPWRTIRGMWSAD